MNNDKRCYKFADHIYPQIINDQINLKEFAQEIGFYMNKKIEPNADIITNEIQNFLLTLNVSDIEIWTSLIYCSKEKHYYIKLLNNKP